MDSAKLVTHLLLAVASLSAAAHRPAKHHAAASKHHSAAGKKHKAVSKQAATTSNHRKPGSRPQRTSKKRRLTNHQLATRQRHTAAAKHRAKNLISSASHRLATHQATRHSANRTYNVIATVYQAVPGQTDGSPFITADNSRIRPRYGSSVHWLALSPDLLKQGGGKFCYGDKVQVGGVSPQLDGVYTVHDTMNRRHRRRIDILTHRREKLHVFAPDAKLRLAQAPRKSRAQTTAVAHARLGHTVRVRAVSFRSRASSKRANYLASAIL
jgi:3D (Asp-Asp-Asp) domain-containing protein